MLFYEPLFLGVFFPTLYAVYLALNERTTARKWTLLVGSAAFYSWGEPLFVPVLFASSLVDYRLARLMERTKPPWRRSIIIAVGVVGNLAVLGFYKYADFVAENLNFVLQPLTGIAVPLPHIALPIGVSFVVFEKITYLIDINRGTCAPAPRFTDYCLFVFFFPKLLAGPILKYHEIRGQIGEPAAVGWDDFSAGFLRLSRGMAKKLLVADPVGAFADQVFTASPGSTTFGPAWLGLVCFTLQIYFDFSGYSDMAIGLARMLGFGLRENFNMPYVSRSLTEFWQRWHMSLSTWIRDYLYVPLGGNRLGTVRTHVNLWICFLACGLWHGAAWNFVLWGAYNGLFLTLDRLFLRRALDRCGGAVATGVTLLIVMLGWTIFRSPSLAHLGAYLAALTDWSSTDWPADMPPDVALTAGLGVILCLLPASPLYGMLREAHERSPTLRKVAAGALIVLLVIAAARATAVTFRPFIYFRF